LCVGQAGALQQGRVAVAGDDDVEARGFVRATCSSTQPMLVPPVVAAMSRPCSMRAGATTLLNAQKGRRM
jgi:hypothetical protein